MSSTSAIASDERSASKTHYEVLEVTMNASSTEIKDSYKRLVLVHHPDKGGSQSNFERIVQAYNVLSDTKARTDYDTKLKAQQDRDERIHLSICITDKGLGVHEVHDGDENDDDARLFEYDCRCGNTISFEEGEMEMEGEQEGEGTTNLSSTISLVICCDSCSLVYRFYMNND